MVDETLESQSEHHRQTDNRGYEQTPSILWEKKCNRHVIVTTGWLERMRCAEYCSLGILDANVLNGAHVGTLYESHRSVSSTPGTG